MPFGWGLANSLVFKKVRDALGFGRCRLFLGSAAPLMRDTLDFFASLNIPIMEIYGMSESGKLN
jgi:long-chain-fatty-acid--CoA ligase ACSBG